MLFGLCGSWALLTPLFGGPDENHHVVRAWGIAGGQLNGEPPRAGTELRAFLVPEALKRYEGFPCWGPMGFGGGPTKLPTCIPGFADSSDRVLVSSWVAEYPPTYYVVSAAPALVGPAHPVTIYAMRFLTAAIVAALLASAFVSVLETRVPAIAGTGLLLALTPLVVFISGTVNASGPEIAAAVLLWTAGAMAVDRAPDSVDVRLVTRAGVAATVIALSRPVSPLWVALIFVALAALGTRKSLAALARSSRVRIWGAIAAGACAFQLAWISRYGVYVLPGLRLPDQPTTEALRGSLGRQEGLLRDLMGRLHWGNFPPSGLTVTLWVAGVGALGLVAAAVARRRVALVILGVALAWVAIPVLVEWRGVLYWRPRYTAPVAVGVPIIAGLALASEAELPQRVLRRLAALLGAVFLTASWVAFASDGHRLTVGASGPLLPWSGHGWSPPVPLTLLYLAYLALLAALIVLATAPLGRSVSPRAHPTS